MRFGRPLLAVLVLALALAVAGCSGSGSSAGTGDSEGSNSGPQAGGTTVVEKGFAFNPASLEVAVGDTVTFINEDPAVHFVRIDGQNLGRQAQGESVTWKAEEAGEYPYTCPIHPAMTGTIIVK